VSFSFQVKRAQDKEKLKDYEKLMLQNEQLIEFKTRYDPSVYFITD
jgi:hypothetical protein